MMENALCNNSFIFIYTNSIFSDVGKAPFLGGSLQCFEYAGDAHLVGKEAYEAIDAHALLLHGVAVAQAIPSSPPLPMTEPSWP